MTVYRLVPLILIASIAEAGENPQQAFARLWEHQSVTVTRALYTLVYDERGKLGNAYANRRDALTVLTPSSTRVVYQFDGRQGRKDVVRERPAEIFDAVKLEYAPDSLELRSYQKVEPILVERYDPGFELVISHIRIERDTVQVAFALPGQPERDVTGLTIRWPAPLSKAFTERDIVEALIRGFVDPKIKTVP